MCGAVRPICRAGSMCGVKHTGFLVICYFEVRSAVVSFENIPSRICCRFDENKLLHTYKLSLK